MIIMMNLIFSKNIEIEYVFLHNIYY